MRRPPPPRRVVGLPWLVFTLALCSIGPAAAQGGLTRTYLFRQTGAATVESAGCSVKFDYNQFFVGGSVPANGRLVGPATTLELAVLNPSSGGYSGARAYGSEASMNRDFPSGTYTLTVGASVSTFTLDLGATVTPPRITDFDLLQAWDGSPLEIRWTPLASVFPDPGYGFSLGRNGVEAIFYPFGQNTAISAIGRSEDRAPANQASFTIGTMENGIAIRSVSNALDNFAGELTGKLGVIPYGSRSSDPGVFAVVQAAGSASGTTIRHAMQVVVEFPVRRLAVPPKILSPPDPVNLSVGGSASFSVTATGGNLAYQWQRDGVAIAGATLSHLALSAVQLTQAGGYRVVVTNAFGSTPSAAATLTVSPASPPPTLPVGPVIVASSGPPVVTFHPIAKTVLQGEPAEFAVGASGAPPLVFQWYRDGEPIPLARAPTYSLLTAIHSMAGRYSVTVQNGLGLATSAEARLTVLAVPRLSNLSVRAPVGSSAGALTIGLTVSRRSVPNITGAESVPMVLRGVGPALSLFGVTDALADPQLAVFNGSALVAENDDWPGTSQFAGLAASVGAFPLPLGSKDAAMFRVLPIGSHSVRISAPANSSGVVLGEIYDTTPDTSFYVFSPRLTNLSALAVSSGGGGRLAAGFTILGSASRTILVRAIGPGLAAVGVAAGFMDDPRLTLFGSGGAEIANNDDWRGTTALSDAFAAVGAFALGRDSRDAALLVVLAPGSYTAEVSSGDGRAGLALIEVYEVP